MRSIFIDASEDPEEEYELRVSSYSPAVPATHDDPGSEAAVEFEPVVDRLVRGRKAEEISLEEFLSRYASYAEASDEEAESEIKDTAVVRIAWALEQDYDDSRQSSLEAQ